MKKLMITLAIAAFSFVSVADVTNSWFTAGFGEGATSIGGAWSEDTDTTSAPVWNESVLVFDNVEKPVVFAAVESRLPADKTNVVFKTNVNIQGFDDLPGIESDAKAGVCALTGGNYYVVAWDEDGQTNYWHNSEGLADFENEVEVTLTTFVRSNKTWAEYVFKSVNGGDIIAEVPIRAKEFQDVCCSGTGSMSSLAATVISEGSADVAIVLPMIEGLVVTCAVERAAIGAEVTLGFVADTKIPSIDTAVYIVGDDGTLTLKEGEDEVEALDPGAKIGTVLYLTLQDAINAAETDDTVTLLANLELTERVAVEGKDITFDLNAKTVTFTDCSGFYFLGCDGAVTNGTVTMDVPATKGSLFAINFEKGNGLVKDVVVYAGNCKYGVTSSCDDCGDDNYNDATVVCENVDVFGSGMLFYAESQAMTLDADCSATQSGENAAGAVHSDALAAGWLGQLTVNGGTYTAEGNVIATMSSPANIKLVAGTFTGAITITPVDPGYAEMGGHIITKAEGLELDPPEGYMWDEADEEGFQRLIVKPVTYTVTITTNAFEFVKFEDVTNNTPFAELLACFAIPEGKSIAGWTPVPDEFVTSNSTYEVELTNNIYHVWFYTNGVEAAVVEYEYGAESIEYPEIEGVTAWSNETFTAEFVFDGTVVNESQEAYAQIAAPSAWDIPGAEGGINALVKDDGTKYVEFTSITFTATGATVGLKAAKIAAQAETFGLICKTDLTKGDTFVINASLSVAEGDSDAKNGLFTISTDLSGYDQLFVVGVGPAAK